MQCGARYCCAPLERGYWWFLYGNRAEQLRQISNNFGGSYQGTGVPVQHPKRGDVSPVTAGAQHRDRLLALPGGRFGELQQLRVGEPGHLQRQCPRVPAE